MRSARTSKRGNVGPSMRCYPIVYLDAFYVNIKVSGRVSKRAVYVVLVVTVEGNKTLLGLWIGEAEAEGAKFWLKVLTDLKNRGVKDILIAFCYPISRTFQTLNRHRLTQKSEHSPCTNRRDQRNQPKIRSTIQRFLTRTNPLTSFGRNTTSTIQPKVSIVYWINLKPL